MKQKRIKSEKARLDALDKMRDEQRKSQEIIRQALKAATVSKKLNMGILKRIKYPGLK